jgi:subtilisin-like proprotein convertase family protein
MIELASIIATLRLQVAANPTNKALAAELQAAMVEYDQLSASLGGDQAPNNDSGLPPSKPAAPAVIPPAPTGCTPITTTFSNNTPVPIPDNNLAGVTSTINVAGAGVSLWDVNVTVNIPHTFPGDLDITLTSPSGTTVTLTTDNGGTNDNVFAGTTFDDQADPNSQIPYAGNPNITTDHAYANLTVATPLTPEEPLGAFTGQNPNGDWTLKVSDDAGIDTGTLNNWSLEITTFASAPTNAPTATFTNVTPVPIPDNNLAGVTSTINVAGAGTSICDVNVTVNITHTFPGDIDLTLTSPSGTTVTLTTDNGGTNDNVFAGTTFNDQADPNSQIPYAVNPNITTDHVYANLTVVTQLTPEEALAAVNGQDPNGAWTLKVSDDAGIDTGTLNSWSLDIVTCSCAAACVLTCPGNISRSNDPNQCGAVVTYPAPTTTGTCGTVTCAPISGSFFPVGTTTVTCTATPPPMNVTTVYSSGNIAVPIPDNNPTGGTATITVPATDTGAVTDVNVRVRLNHTFDSDIAIGLSHANSGNALSNNNGGAGANYGTGPNDCSGTKTIFDDAAATPISAGTAPFAGTFMPQSGLTIHNGSPNDGTWSLTVVDSVDLDSGTIGCFEIETTRQVPSAPVSCSFTVTVNDTQPPTITCPPPQTAVTDQSLCTSAACQVVNFPPPTASDNCPGVTVVCNPPSGGCLPVGVTTVSCTATDGSGNTATCSFSVSVFDNALQDDSNPSIVLLWNSITGQYRFCCNGIVFTGVGKALRQGCINTLDHTSGIDRRVLGRVDKAVHSGTASLQAPPGTIRCVITDRNTLNDNPICQ